MRVTTQVKTAPYEGDCSEQDKLGMAKACEQAELSLSQGESISYVHRGASNKAIN